MSQYDEPYHLSSEDGWPTLSIGMACDIRVTDNKGYPVIRVSTMRPELAERVKLCLNACASLTDDQVSRLTIDESGIYIRGGASTQPGKENV